jgi:preprotein translocase subunit YajC
MTKFALFLAQAAPTTTQPAPGPLQALVGIAPFILMFAAMYFLLIAPQRKKQKEHELMLTKLQPGDEVVTAGGIFGTITSVKDDRFVIRIGDNNAKVEVGKGFISTVVKKADAA